MIPLKNIIMGEFIGLYVKVVDATNPCLVGISGQVVDETKNTFVVKNKRKFTLIKNQVEIEVNFNKKLVRINGKKLTKRPEERIKER